MNSNHELLEKGTDYIYDVCLFDDHVEKARNLQVRNFTQIKTFLFSFLFCFGIV